MSMKRKILIENTTVTESDNFAECVFRNVTFQAGDFAFGACEFFNCVFESGIFMLELCRLNKCAVPYNIFNHPVGHTSFTETRYIVG